MNPKFISLSAAVVLMGAAILPSSASAQGTTPTPAPTVSLADKDDDRDGVPNALDQCGSTPWEERNAVTRSTSFHPYNGCSPSQARCKKTASCSAEAGGEASSSEEVPEWRRLARANMARDRKEREERIAADDAATADREKIWGEVEAGKAHDTTQDEDRAKLWGLTQETAEEASANTAKNLEQDERLDGHDDRFEKVDRENEFQSRGITSAHEKIEAESATRAAETAVLAENELMFGASALGISNSFKQGVVHGWAVNLRPAAGGGFTFGWQNRNSRRTIRLLLGVGPMVDKTGRSLAVYVNGGGGVFGSLGGKGIVSLGGMVLAQGTSYNVSYPGSWGPTSSSPYIGVMPMGAVDFSFGKVSVTLGVGGNLGVARLPAGTPRGTAGVAGMFTVSGRMGLIRKAKAASRE